MAMKSYHPSLLASVAALLLAGCSTAVTPEKSAQIDPAKTGLVLATVAESGVENSWAQFTLRSVDGHDRALHSPAINTTQKLWLVEVPPGRYRIADWTVSGVLPAAGPAIRNAAQELEFEVRPGEVTYLGQFVIAGDLVKDASGQHRTFVWSRPVLEDRAKEANEAFKRQYPALADVPVRSVAPERIDLTPTDQRQLAWYSAHEGYNNMAQSRENESGTGPMPSGPRFP